MTTTHRAGPPRRQVARGIATVGAPVLALIHLSVVYGLVPTSCTSRAGEVATGAVTVIGAGAAVACGLLARRLRAGAGGDAADEREAEVDAFLGSVGQMISALFVLVIVGVGLTAAWVDPCLA